MSLDVAVDESWRGDQVMKENNLNLELASIAPTILVSGLILYLLSSVRSAVATITAAVRARERRTSAVSQRHFSPLFLGRFSPVLRRFSAVVLCCLASWRRDGENGRKMVENGQNFGEKRARNSGG